MDTSEDPQIQVDPEVVNIVISALASLSAPPIDLAMIRKKITESPSSVSSQEMGLDSLGAMEFCIHLELDCDVVISPEDLLGVENAGLLMSIISGHLPHPS